MTANLPYPLYDLLIEWIALGAQVLICLVNIFLLVFLWLGRLQNKRMTNYLLVMSFFSVVWSISAVFSANFVSDYRADTLTRWLGLLLSLYSAYMYIQLLKVFSVLSSFWDSKKLQFIQCSTIFIHIFTCSGGYFEFLVRNSKYKKAIDYGMTVWIIAGFIVENIIAMYISRLVYKDVLEPRNQGSTFDKEHKVSQYKALILSILSVGLLDIIGASCYLVGYFTVAQNALQMRHNLALLRAGATQLGFHAINLANVFLQIRNLKFSEDVHSDYDTMPLKFPV
ncbi:hypothetical protein BC833DRAFT_605831 [Globomyces pollinis-pini]|nr:hypothetical protein BC833DRAFT_605831 [Globomyces pollinis-pini]